MAWKLFRQAASGGSAEAMFRIATMYELGENRKRDYNMALKWFLRSAVRVHAAAQAAIGIFYEDGQAGDRDTVAALFWYTMAAAQGEPFAVEALQRLGK